MTGIFGKLPAHGDFIRRDLPLAFTEPWDQWLSACLARLQSQDREQWTAHWDASPGWCFQLSAGSCGPWKLAGVLLPSQDMVGRRFPLTLVRLLDAQHNPPTAEWYALLFQCGRFARDQHTPVDGLIDYLLQADRLLQQDGRSGRTMAAGWSTAEGQVLAGDSLLTPDAFCRMLLTGSGPLQDAQRMQDALAAQIAAAVRQMASAAPEQAPAALQVPEHAAAGDASAAEGGTGGDSAGGSASAEYAGDDAAAGDAASVDAAAGDSASVDAVSGHSAYRASRSGDAGSGDAGSGDAGSAGAGSGDAGSAGAGSGNAASAGAGSGNAASGNAASADAASGYARSGDAAARDATSADHGFPVSAGTNPAQGVSTHGDSACGDSAHGSAVSDAHARGASMAGDALTGASLAGTAVAGGAAHEDAAQGHADAMARSPGQQAPVPAQAGPTPAQPGHSSGSAKPFWQCEAASHPGTVRSYNEDAYLDRSAIGLWLVADGVGGQRDGITASSAIVAALDALPAGLSAQDLLAGVRHAVDQVHRALQPDPDATDTGLGNPASTLAVLLGGDSHFACLWAGDSRIYLYRDGLLTQLTHDHSHVQELVDSGALAVEDAETHPEANVITRAVGGQTDLELDKVVGGALPGDLFLLCSDGLFKAVPERRMRELLAAGARAHKLLETALQAGARDNVTVLTVCIPAA